MARTKIEPEDKRPINATAIPSIRGQTIRSVGSAAQGVGNR